MNKWIKGVGILFFIVFAVYLFLSPFSSWTDAPITDRVRLGIIGLKAVGIFCAGYGITQLLDLK